MLNPKEKTRHTTLIDVATAAGVSVATASRVFDPKWDGKIRPETKNTVLNAAATLGYHGANALARALQGNRTNIVALVAGSFTGYHYLEVTMRFIHALQAIGKQVLVFEVDPTKDMRSICSQVHQYCVDAIIITAPATSTQIMDMFLDTNIPVLVFGRSVKGSNISAVFCDEFLNAQKAAHFLINSGHKTFGIITGNKNTSSATHRIDGFCHVLKQRNCEVMYLVDGDYTYESGYSCMRDLLKASRPDAVFCAEDSIAMGAMDVAREEFQLKAPDDISIMGFDNISLAVFRSYNLTTMAFPVQQMITSSVEIVERLIERPSSQIERIYDMDLIVRNSVKIPPHMNFAQNTSETYPVFPHTL